MWRKGNSGLSIMQNLVVSPSLFYILWLPLTFMFFEIFLKIHRHALSVLVSHLKTVLWGDRSYQSAVQKVLSSSQKVLRYCFYILLLSRGHKSPDRTWQHLLHSAHLTISLPLLRLENTSAHVHSSRSRNCLCLLCDSYHFFHLDSVLQYIASSSHDCPLWSPRSTWHESRYWQPFSVNSVKMVQSSPPCPLNQPTDYILFSCHFIVILLWSVQFYLSPWCVQWTSLDFVSNVTFLCVRISFYYYFHFFLISLVA